MVMATYIIHFKPVNRTGNCHYNQSVLECAHYLGIDILGTCGGKGTCHSCKIRILSGVVSDPAEIEQDFFSRQEIGEGWRLACQTLPEGNCTVWVPSDSMSSNRWIDVTESPVLDVPPEPMVKFYELELSPPSLSQPQSDVERVRSGLLMKYHVTCERVDFSLLREISNKLRSLNWKFRIGVHDDEMIAVRPAEARSLGMVMDLGTTRITGFLVDMKTGQTISSQSMLNPQIGYGEDIISRLASAFRSSANAVKLHRLATEAFNRLALSLCSELDEDVTGIDEAVVVGNTAMHHLFLGLPVAQLSVSPFIPTVASHLDIKARDLRLRISPGACVHLMPIIGGFVGADHTAMLMATEMDKVEGLQIALDIGTNTEISLVDGGRITTVSCGSGPAFEGGHIKDGMWADSGAIEKVRITDGQVKYETVGSTPPKGICGSGILDAIAQMYMAGIVNRKGRMSVCHPRVRTRDNQREFVLVSEEEREGAPAITVTQGDIREIQLAKAAIRAAFRILLQNAGHTEEEVEKISISGTFGRYINIESAVLLGLLPSLPFSRFHQVGNAACMGAKLALISASKRGEAINMASEIKYLELSHDPDFMKKLIESSNFEDMGKTARLH